MSTTIRKWGNSLGVRIPKKVAEKVGFENGSEIEFVVIDGKIIMKTADPEPTLEDLFGDTVKKEEIS